jgi:hypothetical protein
VLLALSVLFAALANGDTSFLLGIPMFAVGLCALGMRLSQGTEPPSLQLSPRGVFGYVRGADRRWKDVLIPFTDIRSVDVRQGELTGSIALDCTPPRGRVVLETRLSRGMRGVDAEELAHIVAQIRGAADRARAPSFLAEKASRLELLRRGEDTWAGWLARLDALGQSLKGAHNYRSVALDETDLWNALETPEVDAELRTAAARVLVQASQAEAKERVLATLSAERSPAAVKRIRVALEPDAEAAVRELEELERHSAAKA